MVLVGPSGSGKSTALRMLAGLEDIDEGSIEISGKDMTGVPSKDRDIAMVFQNYALYPNKTVGENMGFALKLRGVSADERRKKVEEAAKLLDLTDFLDRKPAKLSGGQRQRVAMGRAIVREPQVFCMDEPLSNLDAKLRVQTRTQIAALQRRLGTTTVYVTHDQVEAMTMGDRVAVLRNGQLQQFASPVELYDKPANAFVAGFIGSPGHESASPRRSPAAASRSVRIPRWNSSATSWPSCTTPAWNTSPSASGPSTSRYPMAAASTWSSTWLRTWAARLTCTPTPTRMCSWWRGR